MNDETERRFLIRGYNPGDEQKINDMFNEVFGQNRELAHWYWKYRDNPYGSHIISLAEAADGTLAAHYAGYPMKVTFFPSFGSAPEESIAYHVGDKMTRKQFREIGRGRTSILARTVEHFFSTFCRDKVPFYIGFLTHHSLRFGVLFLNYETVEPISFRTLDAAALSGLKSRTIRESMTGVRVEEVTDFDERWTSFFSEAAPHYGFLFRRDQAYLKWRYHGRPDRNYLVLAVTRRRRLAGWSVFYREGNRLIWGDALFHPRNGECVRSLFGYLRRHPLFAGIESIVCWFSPRPQWWDIILTSLGFRLTDEPNNLQFAAVPFTDRNALERLRHFYYTMGDSDLF